MVYFKIKRLIVILTIKPIDSICVVSLTVAHSGLLKGRRATTYNHPTSKRLAQLETYGVDISAERIVVDDNIITSANPSTAMEVAFTLLEILSSSDNMKRIKKLMGY